MKSINIAFLDLVYCSLGTKGINNMASITDQFTVRNNENIPMISPLTINPFIPMHEKKIFRTPLACSPDSVNIMDSSNGKLKSLVSYWGI